MPTKELMKKPKGSCQFNGFKFPAAVGFKEEESGLVVTIEVVEKESIPDGMDVLGIYEVRVDKSGSILGYERTDLVKEATRRL